MLFLPSASVKQGDYGRVTNHTHVHTTVTVVSTRSARQIGCWDFLVMFLRFWLGILSAAGLMVLWQLLLIFLIQCQTGKEFCMWPAAASSPEFRPYYGRWLYSWRSLPSKLWWWPSGWLRKKGTVVSRIDSNNRRFVTVTSVAMSIRMAYREKGRRISLQ